MATYLIAVGLIFALMACGIAVQRLYRRFAQNNPELGPFRDENRGCGACKAGSGCSSSSCTPHSD